MPATPVISASPLPCRVAPRCAARSRSFIFRILEYFPCGYGATGRRKLECLWRCGREEIGLSAIGGRWLAFYRRGCSSAADDGHDTEFLNAGAGKEDALRVRARVRRRDEHASRAPQGRAVL